MLLATPVILGLASALAQKTGGIKLRHLANIYRLGIKELWSLWRDPMMLVLIVYTFTVAVYTAGTAMPETMHRAPIAVVDEDDSTLSQRLLGAFLPPSVSLRRCAASTTP